MRTPHSPLQLHQREHSRRSFLGAAAALPLIALAQEAAAQTQPTTNIAGSSLRILTWKHVINGFNFWFSQFATTWGQQNGVAVTVETVDPAILTHAIRTELELGTGHDLIEHIAPVPMFADGLADLSDLLAELTNRYGAQLDFCRQDSIDPTTGRTYGITHGYAPTALTCRPALWDAIGLPGGPTTWDELASGGAELWSSQGVAIGLGLSNDLDSVTSTLSALWAFGAEIQNANGDVAIESAETVEVVRRFRDLYQTAMTPVAFAWDSPARNGLMQNGRASAIVSGLAAYREAQDRQPDFALDMSLRTPLEGPAGFDRILAPAHARFTAMVPSFSPNQLAAREFLLALVGAYNQAATASDYYNFPAFASTVRGLKTAGGPLDFDPNHPDQGNALSALKQSNSWTVNLGWPGPTTRLVAQAIDEGVLSRMLGRAVRDEISPEAAVSEAARQLQAIVDRG